MAALEGDGILRKKSSSWISHADLPRGQSREHSALMSWPELFRVPKKHNRGLEEANRHANSLSARAMQLGIFGSMVRHTQIFPTNVRLKKPHSLSYPGVPSEKTKTRPLFSVQSEGPVSAGQLGQRLRVREVTRNDFKIPVPPNGDNTSHVEVDSSEESGDEHDLVVRIDSPSKLSFNQGS